MVDLNREHGGPGKATLTSAPAEHAVPGKETLAGRLPARETATAAADHSAQILKRHGVGDKVTTKDGRTVTIDVVGSGESAETVEYTTTEISPKSGTKAKVLGREIAAEVSPPSVTSEAPKSGPTTAEPLAPTRPDEASLFGNGPEWAEVQGVEDETAAKATTATPEGAHDHAVGRAWARVPTFGVKWLYNWRTGGKAEGTESLMTQVVREQLIQVLETKLNAKVTVEGLKIDGGAGLVTVTSVGVGAMMFNHAGRTIVIGGGTIRGLELQLGMADILRLGLKGATGADVAVLNAVVIRFDSIELPKVSVKKDAPAKTESATAGPEAPSTGAPKTGAATTPTTEPAKPEPAKPEPAKAEPPKAAPAKSDKRQLMLGVIDSLKLSFHVGSIDFAIFEQNGEDITFGASLTAGALRGLADSEIWKPLETLGKKEPAPEPPSGKRIPIKNSAPIQPLQLETTILDAATNRGWIYNTENTEGRKHVAAIYLGPLQEALADESYTDEERVKIVTAISYLQGDDSAFADHKAAVARQAKAAKAAAATQKAADDKALTEKRAIDRANATKKAAELGLDKPSPRTGGVSIKDVHGGVVGKHASDKSPMRGGDGSDTRGRLEVGSITAQNLGADIGGTHSHLDSATVTGIKASMIQNSVGVQVGGASVTNIHQRTGDGIDADVAGVESLHLDRTSASARLGDISKPEATGITAQAHVGRLAARGVGATKGDAGVSADSVTVGSSDVTASKRGDEYSVDAHGLGVTATEIAAVKDGTIGTVGSVRLDPSAAHAEKSAGKPSTDGAAVKPTISGTAMAGALAVTDVDVDRPNDPSHPHAHVDSVGIGGVTGTLKGTQASADVGKVSASKLHAHSDKGSVDVGSVELDKLTAVGDTSGRTGHVETGALTTKGIQATSGKGTPGEVGASVGQARINPIVAHVQSGKDGLAGDVDFGGVDLAKLEAHKGADAQARVDSVAVGRTKVTGQTGADGSASVRGMDLTVDGIHAHDKSGRADVGRIGTRGLKAAVGGGTLDAELGSLAVHDVDLEKGKSGGVHSKATIDHAAVVGAGVHATDDGDLTAGFRSVDVDEIEASHDAPSGGASSKQRWKKEETHAKVGHVAIGSLGVTSTETPGHRSVGLDRLQVADVSLTNETESDRHTYLEGKAADKHASALKTATSARAVATREADELLASQIQGLDAWLVNLKGPHLAAKAYKGSAEAIAKKKQEKITKYEAKYGVKRAAFQRAHDTAIVKATTAFDVATRKADVAHEKVETHQATKVGKEISKDAAARVKTRGTDVTVGSVGVDSVKADVGGLETGHPSIDDVQLGKIETRGLKAEKQRDDERVDRGLIAQLNELVLDLDETQSGTVTIDVTLGEDALENIIGKKTGWVVAGISGLDGNNLRLEVKVAKGVIELGTLSATAAKNTVVRSRLIKAIIESVQIRGDVAREKQPHLHEPAKLSVMGKAMQLEQLGLKGLQKPDKPVLMGRHGAAGRKVLGGKGGVNLSNLLENGLQAAVDTASKDGTKAIDAPEQLTSSLDVQGIDLTKTSGGGPDEAPADHAEVSVEHTKLGETVARLGHLAPVGDLVKQIGGVLSGKTPASGPTAPLTSIASGEPSGSSVAPSVPPKAPETATPAKDPIATLLAMLEAIIPGGGAALSSAGAGKPPAKQQRKRNLRDHAGGGHELEIFNTAGGGDCGIHAMLGTAQPNGIVSHADPDAVRDTMADVLGQPLHPQHNLVNQADFIRLISDLVIKLLARPIAPTDGDDRLEYNAFRDVGGFWDAAVHARQTDNVARVAHTGRRNLFIGTLIPRARSATPLGVALRTALVPTFMRSVHDNDVALRAQLDHATEADRPGVILANATDDQLRSAITSDLNTIVAIVDSMEQDHPVTGPRYQVLETERAGLDGGVRDLVQAQSVPLLAAYATVVRTPGYYLHTEDMNLMARLNNKDLHLHRQQAPGQFAEVSHENGGAARADVFHSGLHYEQARHT